MNKNPDSIETNDSEIHSKIEFPTELQIHRLELEKQNSKLNDAQQLKETPDRYAAFYDNVPVGYLILDKAGNILAINLTGCTLLGKERASLLNESFSTYIVEDDNDRFLNHLQQTFNSTTNTVTELRVKGPLNKAVHIRLESLVIKDDANICRTVMTNINPIKESVDYNQELLHGHRRLMQNLFKIQEEERRLLARELHDELGQWLTAIHAETETIAYFSEKDSTIHISAQAIKECIKKMHDAMHDMLSQLRPILLDTLGLEDALLELKKQWTSHNPHITLELVFEGKFDKLSELINITIFRIVQEALNNVCNHAQASQVRVRLHRKTGATATDDTLSLSVEDNGKGYNADQIPHGLGLLGMRERAIAAGGKFFVRSIPNHGTQIHAKFPLDSSNRRRKTDAL